MLPFPRTSSLLAVAMLALPALVAARPGPHGIDDFTLRTWNENDGLSASRISAIEQDQDGYLWLGTDAGVVRFDGVRFVPLTTVDGFRMPTAQVSSILSATDRSLWVSMSGRYGLLRVRNGRVTGYGPKEGLPDGYVTTLFEDRSGHVWLGSNVGLFRFDGKRWQRDPTPALETGPILAIHESRDGRLWIATRSAVFRRDDEGAPIVQVDSVEVASNAWQGLSEDEAGVMWITDLRQGFRRVGERSAATPIERGWGVQLLHDKRGGFWVATRNRGLWRVESGAAGSKPVVDVITTKQGLATDAVQCVFEDREGNLWLGTQNGLQRLTPNRVTPIATLPLARSAALTPDGSVWIGSAAGLTRFVAGGQRQYTETDGLGGSVVLALNVDPAGTLWISTENGVSRFQHEQFSGIVVPSDGVVQRVFSMATTSSGTWLRGLSRRLFKVSPQGRVIEPTEIPEALRAGTLVVASDRRDNLWIGASEGRVGVLRPNGRFDAYRLGIGAISAIHETGDGSIWIGGEDGLSRLANGVVQSITAENGLPTHIKAIIDDTDGVLWVGLVSGIARIERKEFDRALAERGYRIQYRLFNTAAGAAGVPMTDGSRTAVRSSDGRLWFATSAGVTVIDPHRIAPVRPASPAVFESVTADARQIVPEQGMMLPARVSNVQFLFTALALTDSMRMQFKYQLEGIDRTWVDGGTTRQASYANLGPGHYRFLVTASNGDGVWSEPTVLAFGINPMFYQTRWFYGLCGVAAVTLMWAIWHLNARRVRKRFALVLAERIRMSRAIHDTLLQGFAGLALQLDDLAHGPDVEHAAIGERLRRIRRRVEDYIREARQSIWDLRSPVLERLTFPDALREVGSRVIADRPVSLDVTIKGVPQPCSPVVEQQLLLICQEAVNNAVRHASPRRVDVELEYLHDALRVLVRDDGRGFDLHAAERAFGHYGVISMRERAAQVRGRLTIASVPGEGTSVETVIPVH